MSALGSKRTLADVRVMSALPPKADIGCGSRHTVSLCPTVRASIVVLRVQNFDAVGSLGHGRIVRQPRPFDCGLAFIRPLRRRAALVVEYAGSDRATSPRPWQQSP